MKNWPNEQVYGLLLIPIIFYDRVLYGFLRYMDATDFMREFKSMEGITPGQYREISVQK